MSNLKELNLKITSLQNTKKITQVMKLISASKFHKAQQAVLKSKNYLRELQNLGNIINDEHDISLRHPLLLNDNSNSEKQIGIVLLTSNKGLCGGFNNNIIQTFLKLYEEQKDKNIKVNCYLLGKKGYDLLKNKIAQEDIIYTNQEIMKSTSYHESKQFLEKELIQSFLTKETQKIYFVYNQFKSTIEQIPVVEQILPYSSENQNIKNGDKIVNTSTNPQSDLYLFEPNNKEEIYNSLIIKIFYLKIYNIFLNMIAGEHSSRMQAMDQATKNGEEMIKTTSLKKNRIRQAAITTELTEIVAGAEALK